MPLINLTNNLTTRVLPLDVALQFAAAETLTASGFVGAAGPAGAVQQQIDLNIGRFDGILVLDLQALKVSAGNETYQFALLASNDIAFGAGNCELMAFHDFAANTAGRIIPSSYLGASPIVPQPGESIRRHSMPFSNQMGGYLLRYLRLLLTVGGTAPSVTLNSWITDRESMI